MKKIITMALGTTLLLSLGTTTLSADAAKGQKLYIKKLKGSCGVSGAVMAGKHSQDEWTEIYEAGELESELKTICPKLGDVKDKFLPHFYDFFNEYASDSGNVPSC
ncbi:MAG: cytochrome C [Campylobacterota bacterium]|nr:cytochrome C [Campylobacterota bacterium]